MCGMCSVRCPMEVTVEDGRVTWLQGNTHDKAIGASLCAKGAAGLAFEADDQRPQTPLIRSGPRGSGQWRRASWDEALDYIADKLKDTIAEHGARGIALSDRGGFFNDLARTFVKALGSPNYFNHDATCGGNVHNAARSIFGFSHAGLVPDFSRIKHLVLYGRNIVESLMVKEVKAFMAAMGNGMRCTYIDPRASATAAKATRFWQVRPNSDYALNLALIHEVLRQEAYDEDFVERWVTGMDVLREAVKDTTPEWQEPHTGVPARELREFVAEIAGQAPQRDLQPGLDDGAPQAVVLRQPHGADPERADGQPRDPGRLHHRQAARVLRPQEPEAAGRARARGHRAARRRRRHHAPDLGPGHRHAAPAVRGDGDRAALRHRRLHRLPPRPAHRDARCRGGQARAGQAQAAGLDRRALFGDRLVLRRHPARIDLPRARQHPGPACPARCRCSRCATRPSRRASTAARPGGSSARSCAAWATRRRSTSRPSRRSGTTSSKAPASPWPRCARPASSAWPRRPS